jgi:hypothetical protein
MQDPIALQNEMLKFLSGKLISPSEISTEFKPIASCCDKLVDCLMNQMELGDVEITTQVIFFSDPQVFVFLYFLIFGLWND